MVQESWHQFAHSSCKLLVLGQNRKTRSIVGRTTRWHDQEPSGTKLVQNIGAIDKLHLSYVILQTILFCGSQTEDCIRGLFLDASFAGDLQDSINLRQVFFQRFGITNI